MGSFNPSGNPERPGPLLLLGAPGSGKGTQAKKLSSILDVPQISTGDLLRENRAKGTPLGLAADGLMNQGKLVPDDLVNKMVAARLAEGDTGRGFILDGYPRTLGQAEWLDRTLAGGLRDGGDEGESLPAIAVNIRVSYTQLLRRITGRRNCPACQRTYNVYLQPPQVDLRCDVDQTPLVSRADDAEDVFRERMRVYEAQTAPVTEFYRARGRFAEVDGEQAIAEVESAILSAISRLRRVQA